MNLEETEKKLTHTHTHMHAPSVGSTLSTVQCSAVRQNDMKEGGPENTDPSRL